MFREEEARKENANHGGDRAGTEGGRSKDGSNFLNKYINKKITGR